jgi:hypothetical protein
LILFPLTLTLFPIGGEGIKREAVSYTLPYREVGFPVGRGPRPPSLPLPPPGEEGWGEGAKRNVTIILS